MIIVGLGNPGHEYELTRHNVGFMVLDKMYDGAWKKERDVVWAKIGPHLLIKPQAFMNQSGPAVRSFLGYKKVDLADPTTLLVVHDDVDFPLGEIHQQVNRSAGGHNGVQSMIDALGTQNFSRLRIGIGNNRELNIPAEAYVLQRLSDQELATIQPAISQAAETLKQKLG